MNKQPIVQDFFDKDTNTFSYVISDPMTQKCAIIDSVLNFDAASAKTTTIGADAIIAYIQAENLSVQWILETHVHADHLTASQYLKARLGGQVAMSYRITIVQQTFSKIYNVNVQAFQGQQSFDYLFQDSEHFKIGDMDAYNIPTPGHTPACLSYVVGDAVFVGDTLFMPDYGTARCDFPNGSAETLFESVQKLYQLPEHTRVYLCHDYLPKGRDDYSCQTTIAAQKQGNVHIHDGITKQDFVAMRHQRDATLNMPKLMLAAIQVNMDAGHFPEPEDNAVRYLKIPINYF